MTHDLQLRGLSERTQEAYLRAVRQLADCYHRSDAHLRCCLLDVLAWNRFEGIEIRRSAVEVARRQDAAELGVHLA